MKFWESSSYQHYKHTSAFLYGIDLYIIRICGWFGQFFWFLVSRLNRNWRVKKSWFLFFQISSTYVNKLKCHWLTRHIFITVQTMMPTGVLLSYLSVRYLHLLTYKASYCYVDLIKCTSFSLLIELTKQEYKRHRNFVHDEG